MKLEETIKEIEALIRLSKDKEFDIKIRNYEINLLQDVLNHLIKQEKMIELMTNFIYHIGYYEDIYGNSCAIIQDSCFKNKTTESCEQCIKQYFGKKVEESE